MTFVRKSLTKYSNKHKITLRIENESFAGDAFMRHLIFLSLVLDSLTTQKIMLKTTTSGSGFSARAAFLLMH